MSIIFISYVLCLCTILLGKSENTDITQKLRANVTLKMRLNYDLSPECDESVYIVTVCVGEFTNKCQLVGPVSRFIQATCAFQGSPDWISFSVSSVEVPLELSVTVQKVGDSRPQQLRGTEFRLMENKEIALTSVDLTLMLHFHATYTCLKNFYGKSCKTFCDTNAIEYRCDYMGTKFCNPDYTMDLLSQSCIYNYCKNNVNMCHNGGTCINRFNQSAQCLCPPEFQGRQCQSKKLTNRHGLNSEATKYLQRNMSNKSVDNVMTPNASDKRSSSIHGRLARGNKHLTRSAQTKYKPHYLSNTSIGPNLKLSRQMEEQKWRKIIIVSTIGTGLVITLFLICIGLIVFVFQQKPSIKSQTKSHKSFQPTNHTSPLPQTCKSWASVGLSPIRLNTFDDSQLPIGSEHMMILPSPSTPLGLQSFNNKSPLYGTLPKSFGYPTRSHTMRNSCRFEHHLDSPSVDDLRNNSPYLMNIENRCSSNQLGYFISNPTCHTMDYQVPDKTPANNSQLYHCRPCESPNSYPAVSVNSHYFYPNGTGIYLGANQMFRDSEQPVPPTQFSDHVNDYQDTML